MCAWVCDRLCLLAVVQFKIATLFWLGCSCRLGCAPVSATGYASSPLSIASIATQFWLGCSSRLGCAPVSATGYASSPLSNASLVQSSGLGVVAGLGVRLCLRQVMPPRRYSMQVLLQCPGLGGSLPGCAPVSATGYASSPLSICQVSAFSPSWPGCAPGSAPGFASSPRILVLCPSYTF